MQASLIKETRERRGLRELQVDVFGRCASGEVGSEQEVPEMLCDFGETASERFEAQARFDFDRDENFGEREIRVLRSGSQRVLGGLGF